VKGVTEDMLDSGAFIGVYEKGAQHNDFYDTVFLEKSGSSTVEIEAPYEDGNYELRMFKEYSGETAELNAALLHKISFTVGNAKPQDGDNPATGGNSGDGSGGGDSGGGGSSGDGSGGGGSGGGGSGGAAVGYPDEWEDAIPKMPGTVTYSMQIGPNSWTLFVDVKSKDVVINYVDSLIKDGYKLYYDSDKDENNPPSEYQRDFALRNGEWDVGATLTFDENQVMLHFAPDVWGTPIEEQKTVPWP